MDEISFTKNYSDDMEYGIIGSICIDPSLVERLIEIVEPEDFVIAACRKAFEAARDSVYAGTVFDAVTAADAVSEILSDSKNFIVECMELTATTANAELHAGKIHDFAKKRRLIDAIRQSIEEDEDNIATNVAGICQDYLKETVSTGHKASEMMMGLYTRMSEKLGNRIDTGFYKLDEILQGLWPGNLIYVGARPGVGKSAFLMDIAVTAAKKGIRTAYYSMEMLEDELAERMAAREAGIPMDKFIARTLEPMDWQLLHPACAKLSKIPLTVYDQSSMTVDKIRSQSRSTAGLGLIVVDYIGLMQSTKRSENRNLELGAISRALKNLATELRIPIVVATQLNRAADETVKPTMKDIRDSGELEQDANKIIFLWKEDPDNNVVGFSVAKNRRGSTGHISMTFDGKYMRFTELDEGYVPEEPYSYGGK